MRDERRVQELKERAASLRTLAESNHAATCPSYKKSIEEDLDGVLHEIVVIEERDYRFIVGLCCNCGRGAVGLPRTFVPGEHAFCTPECRSSWRMRQGKPIRLC